MIEVVQFDDEIGCVKTGTGREGQVMMWVYAYQVGDLLFDAGCANAAEEIRNYASGSPIQRVVVSHTHEDHYGGCAVLADKATIFAISSAIREIREPPKLNIFFQSVWGQPKPVEDVEQLPSTLSVGSKEFEVISLPGHYEDMIGLYEAERGWLFSADAVPLPSEKQISMSEENVPLMIATMEKILALDVKILFDGHRGPIREPEAHIRRRVDYLRALQNRVKKMFEEGKSISEIKNILAFKEPFYLPWTEGRFSIEYLIKSLLGNQSK
ncbi:MAG: MBL fold metallo-hydrolase [Promethearchaeota archaeon]